MSQNTHRKIIKILPGDLISDFPPGSRKAVGVFVISISEPWFNPRVGEDQHVFFLVLGEEFLYEGTTEKQEYFLLSRLKVNPLMP